MATLLSSSNIYISNVDEKLLSNDDAIFKHQQSNSNETNVNTTNAIKDDNEVIMQQQSSFVISHLDRYCTNVPLYRTMVLLARPTNVRC
jgi:hypothetical protein